MTQQLYDSLPRWARVILDNISDNVRHEGEKAGASEKRIKAEINKAQDQYIERLRNNN